MLHNTTQVESKIAPPRPPFPWLCNTCGEEQVEPSTISYEMDVKHDGALHHIKIPRLQIPICRACGAKVFTEDADDQISAALRAHLHLLTPEEIQSAIEQLGVSPAEVAAQIGVSEEQLSFWADGGQIQSRAMDNLLRIYFGFPEVREALKKSGDAL